MGLAGQDASGEAIDVVAFDHPMLIFHSARAFAPGQPLDITLSLDPVLRLALRSRGSRRLEDERFEVRARAVSLTRDARARLTEALAEDG